MQYVEKLELFQRAIRSRICANCYQRPPGSEEFGPEVKRTCEGKCPIFASLPKIVGAAVRYPRENVGAEQLLREMVCQSCKIHPSAGDYCAASFTRTCPLSRYGQDVLELLDRMLKQKK
jgi:hypothetical protein